MLIVVNIILLTHGLANEILCVPLTCCLDSGNRGPIKFLGRTFTTRLVRLPQLPLQQTGSYSDRLQCVDNL